MSAKLCELGETRELRPPQAEATPGCLHNFLGNRYVYIVISDRARGLSIGLNLNPDKVCNFNCVYCKVNREPAPPGSGLDTAVMAAELEKTLVLVHSGQIRRQPRYTALNSDLLRLRHVAFSGDGEPTLCAKFAEAVQEAVHVRARRLFPFFKLVLLTNGSNLDSDSVKEGLQFFTGEDEIWIKLDAGTQSYMDRINRSKIPLDKVMENTWLIGRKRPIVIQSLFPLLNGWEPLPEEIDEYVQRLHELKEGGAMISLVQVYSATCSPAHPDCGHIPLQSLARICRRIKTETGLKAEVF
jgi:wyosine [tRNA(Phe)-imidazoG37] synthetase (radical SAM superfamily)